MPGAVHQLPKTSYIGIQILIRGRLLSPKLKDNSIHTSYDTHQKMISLVHLVLVFFFIFEVIQHIFSFLTSLVKVAMVIMLESTPKKGGERRKRPLHTVDAPDFRSPGVKNLVETVFSCLPLFEPIPASKIAIDH